MHTGMPHLHNASTLSGNGAMRKRDEQANECQE